MPEEVVEQPIETSEGTREESEETEEPEKYSFGISELNKELEEELEPGEELEELDDEAFEEIKINPPESPPFPVLVICFALLKDILDVLAGIFTFGLAGSILNIIAWVVIQIYLFRKIGFIKRWIYKRFIFVLIIEFIPYINWIPQWSFFVVRGYLTEKKKVDQILRVLERLALRHQRGEEATTGLLERFV